MERMAKVTIKGVDKVKQSVIDTFERIKSNEQMLLDIGNKTVELTKAFNRAGKSPTGKRHPQNSESWEYTKIALTKTNKPSEFYQYGLSNVTFTGQLLESIKLFKINRSKGSVEIDASGQRAPYKNLDGSVQKSKPPTNQKLVEYLKEKGRIIFGINKQMQNVINKIVRSYINAEIKKTYKK